MSQNIYLNEERKCECWKCELSYQNGGNCPYYEKFQRHPRDLVPAGLGLCLKLSGNEQRLRKREEGQKNV